MVNRLTAEKKIRQDFEDKHEQLVAKLNFDTRQHEQVAIRLGCDLGSSYMNR